MSDDTLCVWADGDALRLPRCDDPVSPCGADDWCVPASFDTGGLCAIVPDGVTG